MSATPPVVTVEMPVKRPLASREVWLFGLSGVMAAVSAALAEVPVEWLTAVPWAPAAVKLVIGTSAVLGLLVRLSRPDIASGVPWLDRGTPK